MAWLNPTYLWLLAVVPLVVLLLVRAAWLRRKVRQAFGSPELLDNLVGGKRSLRGLKSILLVPAVLLLVVALAGPRMGTRLREVKREGIEIVIALDVSESMMAEDVAPSRLERARYEIRRLLDRLKGGDRVGLVLFAGEAFIQCPLTSDYNALRMLLDVAGPDLIPTPGTDFSQALRMSVRAFESQTDSEREARPARALLVVSDGENHTRGFSEALEEAREAGVVVFAAGVGETAGTSIPVVAGGNVVGYKHDSQGRPVVTRLEERSLRTLAREGAYYRIGTSSGSLASLPTRLERLNRTVLAKDRFEDYREQYQVPLAVALALLALEMLLPDFRRARRKKTQNGDVA